MTTISLVVRCTDTQWGESLAVVGSWCEWKTNQTTPMDTSAETFPKWNGVVWVPDKLAGKKVQYKYVIVKNGDVVRWENGDNRSLSAPPLNAALAFDDGTYGDGGRSRQRQIPVVKPGLPDARQVVRAVPTEEGYRLGDSPPAGIAAPLPTDRLPALERVLLHTTSEKKSWRQRLQFVCSLLAPEKNGVDNELVAEAVTDAMETSGLSVIAAYLSFMSTGQLPCAEDGRHYRPNHHADAARRIEESLTARNLQGYEPYVARRVYTLLPSYSSQFTVATPLTRIRDIAHRNDIPHEMKQEIKHTLQNKLHRCAGPEDLVTCSNLLERVEQGGYSHDFVAELRKFHSELLEFFNAASLDERLEYLDKEHGDVRRPVQHLRRLKAMNAEQLEQLSAVTTLRRAIVSSQTMNDSNEPSERQQKLRLADIELESYAFPLLSAVTANVENDLCARAYARLFNTAYPALSLAFQNIELSGVRAKEASAIAAELDALESLDEDPAKHVTRAKAAIDRASAFTDNFALSMGQMYGERVVTFAAALGVEARAAAVFAEAEIRANVTFLASRLAEAAGAACRHILELPPWDPLFVGETKGRVVYVDKLQQYVSSKTDGEAVIVVAKDATGEEDIPSNVVGIVLGRPLPHLSHLGVRARQAKVVFVCAEDTASFEDVWKDRKHKFMSMTVNNRNGLQWEGIENVELTNGAKFKAINLTDITNIGKEVTLNDLDIDGDEVVPLCETTKKNGSGKCFSVAQMRKLAAGSGGLFEVPAAVCVTHAAFATQMAEKKVAYQIVVDQYQAACERLPYDEAVVNEAAAVVRTFIETIFKFSRGNIEQIQEELAGEGDRVMVRSSANAEDLEKMSGAGLYDSIANVSLENAAALSSAVRRVWGSVWTNRAASSRQQYGVAHDAVSMAVLVQVMASADLSFVAFSRDPVAGTEVKDDVYMELAVGLGETLASGVRGTPYRMSVSRRGLAAVRTLALANISESMVAGEDTGEVSRETVDYSTQRMTYDTQFRAEVASRIAAVVVALEKTFGGLQDVEGALEINGEDVKVIVVQSRPQIM